MKKLRKTVKRQQQQRKIYFYEILKDEKIYQNRQRQTSPN